MILTFRAYSRPHCSPTKNTLSRYIQVCERFCQQPQTSLLHCCMPSLPWTRGGLLFKGNSGFGDYGESGSRKSQKKENWAKREKKDSQKQMLSYWMDWRAATILQLLRPWEEKPEIIWADGNVQEAQQPQQMQCFVFKYKMTKDAVKIHITHLQRIESQSPCRSFAWKCFTVHSLWLQEKHQNTSHQKVQDVIWIQLFFQMV